jgi:hypothetical protein
MIKMKPIVVITIIFSKSDTIFSIKDLIIYSSDASVIKMLKKYNALKINIIEDRYYLDPIYLIPMIIQLLEYRNTDIIIMSKIE